MMYLLIILPSIYLYFFLRKYFYSKVQIITCDPHSDADVGFLQGREVIDTIAGNRSNQMHALAAFDDL